MPCPAGTMGPAGNIDPVVPFKTQTYRDGGQAGPRRDRSGSERGGGCRRGHEVAGRRARLSLSLSQSMDRSINQSINQYINININIDININISQHIMCITI